MKKTIYLFLLLAIMAVSLVGCQENNITPSSSQETTQNSSTTTLTNNIVKPPVFIDPNEAIAILESRSVGTDPWQIKYVGSDYVYITYNFGVEFIFRYCIKENNIDKVLDTREIFPVGIETPHSANCAFSSDGKYAIVIAGFVSNNILTPDPVYRVDFDKDEISILSDDAKDFSQPPDVTFYSYENTWESEEKYIEYAEKDSALPQLYSAGWAVVGQIDKDNFFLILPNDKDDANPGSGYYYYKLLVVNVAQSSITQEYRFDSIK